MEATNRNTYFVVEGFIPNEQTARYLIADASMGAEPVFGIFDEDWDLRFFGPENMFAFNYPNHSLASISFQHDVCIVPEMDVMLMPNALFDPQQQKVYENYLLNDGVTPVRILPCERLKSTMLYRERLHGLEAFLNRFPNMERRPISHLLLERSMQSDQSEQRGSSMEIHVGDKEATVLLKAEGKVIYLHTIQVYTALDFNYYFNHWVRLLPDQSDYTVYLSGLARVGGPFWFCVSKYTENIYFTDPDTASGPSVPAGFQGDKHQLAPTFVMASLLKAQDPIVS